MQIIKKLSDNSKEYYSELYNIIDNMQDKMKQVEFNKNVCITYIEQIIPHHNATKQISENILKYTTNFEIEKLAKETINAKDIQIKKLEELLLSCNCDCSSQKEQNLYMRKFNAILENTIKELNSFSADNNIDRQYLNSLLIMNESLLAFTKNALMFLTCENLKDFLQTENKQTLTEIIIIKSLLKNNL